MYESVCVFITEKATATEPKKTKKERQRKKKEVMEAWRERESEGTLSRSLNVGQTCGRQRSAGAPVQTISPPCTAVDTDTDTDADTDADVEAELNTLHIFDDDK